MRSGTLVVPFLILCGCPQGEPAQSTDEADAASPALEQDLAGQSAADLASSSVCGSPGTPKRLLYITKTGGYRHASIGTSHSVMRKLAADSGWLSVDISEDMSLLSAANLKNYDALFFFTTGNILATKEQRDAFVGFLRDDGKAFVGAHSATDTSYDFPEYGEMIGGYFDGHPWVQEAGLVIEDPQHPVVAGLPVPWKHHGEWYQFRSWSRSSLRVLLRLDNATIDLSKGKRADMDYVVSWVKRYGRGCVFYTSMGHFDKEWEDALFQKHLLSGIRLVTGLANGNLDPSPR